MIPEVLVVSNKHNLGYGDLKEVIQGIDENTEIIGERDITVIPDVLANSGGVTVSYYEWVQSRSGEYWDRDKVLEKLRENIQGAYREFRDLRDSQKLYGRDAAYMIGAQKIVKSMKVRN